MIVSRKSTEKRSIPIYKTNTTWNEVHTFSPLNGIRWKELLNTDAIITQVRELVHKLAAFANVKRVRAIAPRFPDIHDVDFELELQSETELSDEVWNNVQNLVIDYEWKLRDISSEKWYFHAQVRYRLSLLQDATKVIADSCDRQRPETGIRTWSSPPIKLVVH